MAGEIERTIAAVGSDAVTKVSRNGCDHDGGEEAQ